MRLTKTNTARGSAYFVNGRQVPRSIWIGVLRRVTRRERAGWSHVERQATGTANGVKRVIVERIA